MDTIRLPGNYFLTASGVQYCSQAQIPLREIRNRDGYNSSGFEWKLVKSAFLAKLIIHGLVSRIEINRLEFVSKRKEIMRMADCIFEGILLKKFKPVLKQKLRGHELISKMLGREFNSIALKAAISTNGPLIARLKKELFSTFTPQSAQSVRFLERIDDEIMLLLAVTKDPVVSQKIEETIRETVAFYSHLTEMSDYIALFVMEFVQFAERAHFMHLAERDQRARKQVGKITELLAEQNFRERLIERAEQNQEMISIAYEFSGNPQDPLVPTQVRITIRNRGLVGVETRKRLTTQKIGNVESVSLSSVLHEQERNEGNESMALLYFNSIQTLCQSHGLALSASTSLDQRKNETITKLEIRL